MKRWLVLTLLLISAMASWGQSPPAGFVNVVATQIYGQAPAFLTAGTMNWQAVDTSGNPISYQANGVGQVITVPTSCAIVNGAITSPCYIADTNLTAPQHVCFSVTIRDNNNNLVLGGPGQGYSCVQPFNQGSNQWSFDSYNPNIAGVPIVNTPTATVGSRGFVQAPNCLALGANYAPQSLNGDGSWNCLYTGNMYDSTFLDENPATIDSGLLQHKFTTAVNVTRISCTAEGGSASINFDVRTESAPDTPGANLLSTPLVCNTGSTATVTNGFATSSIAAHGIVALDITSVSGATFVRVHLETKQ